MTNEKQGQYFAVWLDRTLIERGITGREAARAVGVSDAAVSKWRHGTRIPRLDEVMKLADLLGVDSIRLAVTAGLIPAGMGDRA